MFGRGSEDREALQGWKDCIDNAHHFGATCVAGFTGRVRGKPLPVVVAEVGQLAGLGIAPDLPILGRLARLWPAPLTVVLPLSAAEQPAGQRASTTVPGSVTRSIDRSPPATSASSSVTRARVTVDGRTTGEIGRGLLLLAGFTERDGEEALAWMAEKVSGLRVFADDEGKMNLSVADIGGGILVVSQFTLYGDTSRGRRPSFVQAAPPEVAVPLYERFVEMLRSRLSCVETGEFGAMMEVELVNDGPVTLVLER